MKLGGSLEIAYVLAVPTICCGSPATRYHMPTCDYCGDHVSERFERVFADDDGRIRACPNCSANAGIAEVSKRRIQDASPAPRDA